MFRAERLYLSMDAVRGKRCYRHLVCCMTGLGYNPHTFSIIHNQPKAPTEDEGQEEMFMKHLFTMLLALVAATASAQDFEKGGIYYRVLSEDDRTVMVITEPDEYKGDIVIPEEVIYDSKVYLVTTIGDEAFSFCSALTSVSMPSVTTIGDEAFFRCYALTSVSMPSVTTIGDNAFEHCEALTSVHIPASCTSIAGNPFQGCESLEGIVVDENNPNYSSMDGVLYDKYMSTLIACPGKKSSIDMSSSVTTIGDGAFGWSGDLTSVSMPSVTTIGDEAFYRCYALTSVSMPSVTTIGDNAFSDCLDLTSVDIPASCTSIAGNPFQGCKSLEEIVVDENNPNYSSADGVLYDKDKTTLIGWPTAEGEIDIMPSVTTIGEEAFRYCFALTSVSMPSVTTIGDYAFNACEALTSVSMPSVTTIGVGAFEYCSSLTSIDIPASVTMIGDYAFYGCSSLTSVYCHWEQPLECNPGFEDEIFMNATLYVPTGSIDAYDSVYPWGKFINIEEKDYSGIADTLGSGLSVKVIDGAIVVEGGDMAVSAPVVEVYSAGGGCVYRGTDSSIGGLGHGIYVVRVGGTVQKVAL